MRSSSGMWVAATGVATLAASLVAGGCAVGPDYKPPTPVAGAEVPLVSTSPTVETVAEPPDDWWHLYHDETLDGLLKEAFTANTDLRVAAANLTASRAVLSAVKAQRFPQTQADVAATYGRDPVTEEILELTGRDAESLWIYEGVLEVAYEVDLLGRVRRSVEAARADTAAVIATRDVVKIAVAAETARAYAQVCALGEELNVAHHSLDVVSHEAEITNNRLEAGAGAQFDVVRAQELVAQVRASIPPLEGQRRAAFFELAAVLGRPPSKAPAEVESCVLPPRLSDLMPVGDGASLLKRRPDVREAERRLAGATARIGIATADLYPKIELKGFIGGVSTEPDQFVTNKGIAWGVGPAISWTFPNQAGPRARVRQAKAATVAALANFDAVVLSATSIS
jgi:NodT family efflux transporter outer membrane factor (OMF) lipoprotein